MLRALVVVVLVLVPAGSAPILRAIDVEKNEVTWSALTHSPLLDHNAGMEDKPVKRAAGGAAVVAVVTVVFIVLPLIYLLAIGPIVWLHERGLVSVEPESVIGRVYYPAELAAQYCPPFERAIETYVQLWRGPEPPVRVAPTYSLPVSASLPAPAPTPAPAATGSTGGENP